MMMITIVWKDGIPCILLPAGIISSTNIAIIKPINSSQKNNFTRLQKVKENDCLKDLLGELKDKFKEQKE
ncbi:MAG: hypothetical protein KAX18_03645 [Candidatus Lokiarchaeota archaeon]|nr:hypothetical protein [Candidatus Lokiarchaeota archaeon]